MRTLVFLHGFLEDATMWKPFNQLEKEFHCIYLDLPGHGQKKHLKDACSSMQAMAQQLFSELSELELSSYDCIGHSMGGYVALELARLDNRMNNLILLNSNHWEDSEEKKQNRVRVAKAVQKNLPLFVREAIPNLFVDATKHKNSIQSLIAQAEQLSPEVVAHCSLAMKNRSDFSTWVAQNEGICYLVQGALDKTVLLEVSQEKWAGKKANMHIIQACGHMGHLEKTEEVLQLIQEIVK